MTDHRAAEKREKWVSYKRNVTVRAGIRGDGGKGEGKRERMLVATLRKEINFTNQALICFNSLAVYLLFSS